MDKSELKAQLIELKQSGYSLENVNLTELTGYMVKHLGSVDSELRDQLIYGTFYKMIINDFLGHDDLKRLLQTVLSDDYLFNGLGLETDDSVFTRSFSTLIIALILDADNRNDFLTDEEILLVKERLIQYMDAEQDARGYVTGKGWAHSIAHAADAFDELAKSRKIERHMYCDILNCILNKVHVHYYVYHDDEDERLITPIITMLRRGLPQSHLIEYVAEIPNFLEQKQKELDVESYYTLYSNLKIFLRSLYFRTKKHLDFKAIKDNAENIHNRISHF